MIVIIDYGMGNLGSVMNMFRAVGVRDIHVSSDIKEINKANKLILPGVGSFNSAMINLRNLGLVSLLNHKVLNDKIPILGICLGMQLFFEASEEGNVEGLGWIKGKVVRFYEKVEKRKFPIPHMGWNYATFEKKSKLMENSYPENKFYFVHSYHACCDEKEDILMSTKYGYKFTSAIQKGNIYGFQFHPEKSHKYGKILFKNFLKV